MRYWKEGDELNNGKYTVEQILGCGGFGVTYKIRQTKNNKLFALKTLNLEARSKPDFPQLQAKFINEAIALASCRHPNIVRVYPQGFQENELWCMVMEYVEGEDLSCYLDRHGKLEQAQAVEIITKVGEALHFVHQQELLHRDIKPANILLRNSNSKPVLIDFGLAREYTHGQSIVSMSNSRTLSFAPPEQFQERGHFGAWTDVYALAATLYVLLTNELPLPALFRPHADLKPPQEFNSNISDRLNEAILQGMAMEISDRPQSIEEWLSVLSISESKKSDVSLAKLSENSYRIYELIPIAPDFLVTAIIYCTVCRAYERESNIPVVIKTNGTEVSQAETYRTHDNLLARISRKTNEFLNPVSLLKNEAQLLQRLNKYNHPNLVRYRCSFEENSNFYLVLNEIKGKTLSEIVQQQGTISEAKAIKYIREIGSALITCHENDVYHLDIHPGNIIIDSQSDRAILIDFSVAANPHLDSNYWFQPKKTYGYEDHKNKIQSALDVYSLAATLYYLITGQNPTSTNDWKNDDIWFASGKRIEPKRFNLGLSEYLNFAILKGMDFVKERPQSIKEWLKLLNPVKRTGIIRYAHQDRIIDHRYRVKNLLSCHGKELKTCIAENIKLNNNYVLQKIGLTSNWKQESYVLIHLAQGYRDLHHKKIPKLVEHFGELWCYYWIYEHIKGQSLDEMEIVEGKSWKEADVIDLSIEVLEILSFIHIKGYIHGAIKPSCLLRDNSDRQIFLTNILARRIRQFADSLGNHVHDKTINGIEYLYEAPELMDGYIRPNSDIYSLGIIMIKALSGLSENNLWGIMYMNSGEHQRQDIISKCSEGLANVIEKMTQKNPQKRYQTAAEAIADLNQLKLTNEQPFWRKLFF